MRKRRNMAKRKTVVVLALISAFAITGILSLIFVLAAQTQTVSSSISITYISDNVTADITAKYWIKDDNRTGVANKGQYNKQTIGTASLSATDPAATSTLGSVNEALTSSYDTIIFEYAFKNNSKDAAFTVDLLSSPAKAGVANNYDNINENYYVSGREMFDRDFNDVALAIRGVLGHQPIMAQRVDEYDALLDDTVYIYVLASIDDLRYNANYAGQVQWYLNYFAPTAAITETKSITVGTDTYEYTYFRDNEYSYELPVAFVLNDITKDLTDGIDSEHNCYSAKIVDSIGSTTYFNESGDPQIPVDVIGYYTLNLSYQDCGGHEYEFDMTTSALPEAQQKYVCKRCGREHAVTTGLPKSGTTLSVNTSFSGNELFIPYGITTVAAYAYNNGTSGTAHADGALTIEYVYMPPTMTTISQYAFNACPIRYISIPYGVVTIEQYAFSDTHDNQQTYLRIPDSVTGLGRYAFWKMKYDVENVSLTSAPALTVVLSKNTREIRNGTDKGAHLASGTFGWCKIESFDFNGARIAAIKNDSLVYNRFTSIEIPNTVTSFYSKAMNNNTALTSITIPNSVTEIGSNCFNGCTSLVTIVIPGHVWLKPDLDDSSITEPYQFFKGCTSLVNLTGPIDKQDLLPDVSDGQINLTIVGITNISEFYATNQGRFKGCTKIGTLTIVNPESIGYMAFNGCTSLTEVNIEGTSLNFLGAAAFSGCTALTKFEINHVNDMSGQGEFNKLSAIEFKNDVFDQCTSLTWFIIPNGSTFTGTTTFDRCSNLQWVYIGTGVTFVVTDQYSDGAFMRCPSSMYIFTAETSQPSTWPTGWNDVGYHEAVDYITPNWNEILTNVHAFFHDF